MTALLSAHALAVQTADRQLLLSAVSLQVHSGEVVGIIGANGAGKSTLLKVLAGIRPAPTGHVLLAGQEAHLVGPLQRARLQGYLEQRPVLHWPMQVQQVVALARLAFGDGDLPAGTAAITAALAATGMSAFARRDFQQLSEGEKLLVNLARVLAGEPRLLLADEPTAALDPAHQHRVMQLLRQRAQAGMGVLVVLHDLTLAARYCDRLLLLHAGAVMAEGLPGDVLTPANLQRTFGIDAELDAASRTVIIHTGT